MTSAIHGKKLLQLGFCLLLASHMLLWSTTWSAPVPQESQFEQWGDRSPPFLMRTGDSSPGDIPLAYGEAQGVIAPTLSALATEGVYPTPARRIRITSFPVLPQAPPALT